MNRKELKSLKTGTYCCELGCLNVKLLIPVPILQTKWKMASCDYLPIFCIQYYCCYTVTNFFLFLRCKLYNNLLHCLTCMFISSHENKNIAPRGKKKQTECSDAALLHQTSLPQLSPSPPPFSKSRNNKKEQLFKDEEVLAGSFFSPT